MNLETYILTSDYSNKPLAAIRAVGPRYEILEDNTDGQVDQLAQGDFNRLKQIVAKSSHMKLVQDDRPMPQYHRYMLNNGDIVEITSDGKTALLNGELLGEQEKAELLNMLATNQLQVEHGREDRPLTAMPKMKVQEKEAVPVQPHLNSGIMSGIDERKMAKQQQRRQASVQYDPFLEKPDFGTLDQEFTKQLGYGLKYGAFKGDRNGSQN
jgi:hypothetical protein